MGTALLYHPRDAGRSVSFYMTYCRMMGSEAEVQIGMCAEVSAITEGKMLTRPKNAILIVIGPGGLEVAVSSRNGSS